MTLPADPVAIARDLLRCRSVTPAEGGALAYLDGVLKAAGFTVHRPKFVEPGTAEIENLYARIGTERPHLVFAGHTDVVPPGDEAAWSHDPFAGEIADGVLFGRGAVDMKGSVACFVAAALDHLEHNGGKPKGSLSLLITGDEEDIAVNGTVKLLVWAAARGETFDHCILGEPTNAQVLGDAIKIGRRGSLNGTLLVAGRQGHVAYPERAENPIRGLVRVMGALLAEPLDAGSAHFDPSNLEFTSVDVGNRTVNLIPAEARARFNIRFNNHHTRSGLKALIEQWAAAAAAGARWRIDWEPSNADVFLTQPGPFVDLVADAVADVTGRTPHLSTSGGTSDARFIKDHCPVIEFGLVGATMHQVDERTAVADLVTLTAIYRQILDRYFAA
jgi:succinyl-diaminopimelate desuccinylase